MGTAIVLKSIILIVTISVLFIVNSIGQNVGDSPQTKVGFIRKTVFIGCLKTTFTKRSFEIRKKGSHCFTLSPENAVKSSIAVIEISSAKGEESFCVSSRQSKAAIDLYWIDGVMPVR